jgi:tRNA (cmo5U34)-methyltransferase
VPGYHDIHTMASVLLAEETPADAHLLVLGAGGGLEIKAFATAHPRWRFLAVDTSAPMIDLAKDTLGPLAARMDVHEGYVDDAPEGPFDAYLLAAGNQPAYVEKASEMINQYMPAVSPDEDRAILERAGFTNVTEFFSAFTFRGWVGYA